MNTSVRYVGPSLTYSSVSLVYTGGHIKGTRISCLLYFYSYFDRRTQGLLCGLSYMNTKWGITFIVSRCTQLMFFETIACRVCESPVSPFVRIFIFLITCKYVLFLIEYTFCIEFIMCIVTKDYTLSMERVFCD